MFELMVLIGAGIGGFVMLKNFVVRRLRYVDAVHSPIFPLLTGIGVALVSWPLAALPLVTTATSAFFGLGAGLGARSGSRALKSGG